MTRAGGYVSYCFAIYYGAWWIKIGKLILHAKRTKALFTERNGHVKFIKIPLSRWRIRLNKEQEE